MTPGPRWWDRAINALVPAALIAAMIAHLFPFFVPSPGLYPIDLNSGLSAFFIGLRVLTVAPLDPFFEAFSLPLIAAFVGLMYLRRPGWIGSLAPLVCSVVGLTCLGSAYFWKSRSPWPTATTRRRPASGPELRPFGDRQAVDACVMRTFGARRAVICKGGEW